MIQRDTGVDEIAAMIQARRRNLDLDRLVEKRSESECVVKASGRMLRNYPVFGTLDGKRQRIGRKTDSTVPRLPEMY